MYAGLLAAAAPIATVVGAAALKPSAAPWVPASFRAGPADAAPPRPSLSSMAPAFKPTMTLLAPAPSFAYSGPPLPRMPASYGSYYPSSFETAVMLGELDEACDEDDEDGEGFTADELAILESAVFRKDAAAIGTQPHCQCSQVLSGSHATGLCF